MLFNRRLWLQMASAGVGAAYASSLWAASLLRTSSAQKRAFTIDLVCGAVGIEADQEQAITLAITHGFESVEARSDDLAALSDDALQTLKGGMAEHKLRFGAAGLPVEFRQDDAIFKEGIKKLPAWGASLKRAGVTRVGTWLRPAHNELTYSQNMRQHATRLRQVGKILGENGLRFGLEYVGPKTSWTAGRHSFVHTMAETKELLAEIGLPNMGFVLDSWHWYHAQETADDIRTLKATDVVAVDLNDAPAGIERDQQNDLSRELPVATGVIDVAAFLKALVDIGYDGPVRAEPFNAPLNALDNSAAAAKTSAAMHAAFKFVDDA